MKVLISGAGIAGLAGAHWLHRTGHEVTVVDRSDGPRSGGVAIDVRGAALDVVREMGIHDQIARDRVPHEDVYRFLDRDGSVAAVLRPAEDVYDSPEDIEISRDRLIEILAGTVPAAVTVHYDRWVTAVDDTGPRAAVEFSGGERDEYDLVVGADGMHSGIRCLAFGPEEDFVHDLGLYVGIVRSCAEIDPPAGSEVLNLPGRMVMLRGDGVRTSAILGFRSAKLDHDFRDRDRQRALVRAAFDGVRSWLVPQVLSEVDTSADFYFDSVGQVRMSSWSRGSCVLVGDAGYCPSFFSGLGTTLALVGARALAVALASHADRRAALAAYDTAMAPVVAGAQAVAETGAALLFPQTWPDIEARNAALTSAADR
jgi:2-polyprenyl-6-methoxyphenol hydroxylase-like FAD-dependent oxidoreductase